MLNPWYYFCVLCKYMYNKLIIASFAFFLSLTALSQDLGASTTLVSTTESNFSNKAMDLDNKIQIYPNPAVEFLIVEIDNDDLTDAKFEMHSIIGNKIQIKPINLGDGRFRIPVKDLSTGYYFLVIKDDATRFKKAYRFLKH